MYDWKKPKHFFIGTYILILLLFKSIIVCDLYNCTIIIYNIILKLLYNKLFIFKLNKIVSKYHKLLK